MIEIIRIPALQDNYIWLIYQPRTRCGVIVDPGEAKAVLNTIKPQDITLCAIFLTHHHWDHCSGVAEILEHFDIPVYGPKKENLPLCSHQVEEGDIITIESVGTAFQVLEVPGHTLGHIAYFDGLHLFCGDTLFTGGCGRLFEGSAEQMLGSLKKLKNLPLQTLIYCGHEYTLANLEFAITIEPQNRLLAKRLADTKKKYLHKEATVPSTLRLELKTNPFLRTDISSVIEAVNHISAQKFTKEAEIFLWIRERKNQFRLS